MFYRNFAVTRLLLAIAEHEGWSPQTPSTPTGGTRSYRNHNPGNLRSSPFQHSSFENFAVFESDNVGFFALYWDILQKRRGNTSTGLNGDSTLEQLINVYAPESDGNDTKAYIQHITSKTGLNPKSTLAQIFDN